MTKLLTWIMVLVTLAVLLLSFVPLTHAETEVHEGVDVTDETDEVPHTEHHGDDEVDADEDEVLDSDEVGASPFIHTAFIFPQHQDKRLPIGEEITALVSITNTGDSAINVTDLGALLHSPYDYSYVIQNFSRKGESVIVAPDSQTSFEYKFMPDKSLEPLELLLSAFVQYSDPSSQRVFRSTYFNGTVTLIETSSTHNIKAIFQYVLALAVLGLALYAALTMTSFGKSLKKHASRSRKVEQGTKTKTSSASDSQWGEVHRPALKSRVAGARRSNRG